MTPVWLPPEAGEAYLSQRLPGGAQFHGPFLALGSASPSGVIKGVTVLHRWSPTFGTIEVSAASDRRNWMSRGYISCLFSYVFDEAKCQAAVGISDAENEDARRFWLRMGASETQVPHLSGEGRPSSIYVFPKAAWESSKYRSLP